MLLLNHPQISPRKIIILDSMKNAQDFTKKAQDSIESSFLIVKNCEEQIQIALFLRSFGFEFAIAPKDLKTAILAVNAGASFLLYGKIKDAKAAQKLAENYLFSAKILLKIKSDEDIEKAAMAGIDGVIYENKGNLWKS